MSQDKPAPQSCLSCQFHHTIIGADKQMMTICRKSPPTMVSYPGGNPATGQIIWANNILWPIVTKDDWCGAYERERVDGRVAHDRIVLEGAERPS